MNVSFLDRFKRNQQTSVLPDEVKEYYQSERRQKRGVAAGLAFVALVVTVAVAAAIFFGGRFAYNQIWGDEDEQSSDTAQNENQGQSDEGETKSDTEDEQQPQGQSGGETAQPTPAPSPAPQPQPAPAPPATPSLGDEPEPLPHTGDPGM
jgi:cytoskeletal protein RodZ